MLNSGPTNEDRLIMESELSTTIRDILENFQHATLVFSYVFEPNLHQVTNECVSIVNTLCNYENNDNISLIIHDIKVKWIKYFYEFS